ncbi:MAG: hypothetical protein AB7O28_18260 [Vicinamibacterales bacterium]
MAEMARIRRSWVAAPILASMLLVGVAAGQEAATGTWDLDVDSPQGTMKAGLVLAVDGDTVKGSIASEMGETAFTGTVKAGTVAFTFDMAGPQGAMTIRATATVSGNEMRGEFDFGSGVAPFTGRRTER